MVARTTNNQISRRDDCFYDIHHKNYTPHTSSSNLTDSDRTNPRSTMEISDSDKENHLIEAIVFTTDFLSCAKEPSKGSSSWIFGSGSSETIATDESSTASDNNNKNNNNDDGWFGVKRRQLISYENADDLTRKVNDLFHRKRSSSGVAAAEIRDDLLEESNDGDDDDVVDDESSDRRFFSNLQRRLDDAATISTCQSTSPSLSQDELSQWFSSSWSSFTYYGSARESYGMPAPRLNSKSNSKSTHYRPQRSVPTPITRRDRPSSKRRASRPSREYRRHGNRRTRHDGGTPLTSRSSSSSMPDFLRGVEYKNTNHHEQQLPVINLPESPPTSFSSWDSKQQEQQHREMVPPAEAAVLRETQNNEEVKPKNLNTIRRKTKDQGEFRHRRLGRKTRDWVKRLLRR